MSAVRLRGLVCVTAVALALLPTDSQARVLDAPTSGTWTFTDLSPDPNQLDRPPGEHCHGN